MSVAMCLVLTALADGQERVDTKAALAQIVKRVEPVWPAEAAAAKIGGRVVADVTIGVDGRVSAAVVVAGPALLHVAATQALRQWEFTPFLHDGRPRAVTAIVDVAFPDLRQDEEKPNHDTLSAARIPCERELERSPAGAVAVCREAARIAERMPSSPMRQSYDEVEQTRRAYMSSLIAAAQFQDAMGVARQLIANRGTIQDSIVAEYFVTLARLQQRVGAHEDGEASFATAHALYDAIKAWSTSFTGEARRALQDHAAFRRARGDALGAAELDRRAAAITAPDPATTTPRRTMRQLDGITIVESPPAFITADDLRHIRSIIAPQRAWWIAVDETFGIEPEPVVAARVCIEPDVIASTFHRGICVLSAKKAGVWARARLAPSSDEGAYLRVPHEGSDPSTQPPIRLDLAVGPLPPDHIIADAIRFVRDKAAPRPTGRQKNDVQPFSVETVWVMPDQQLMLIARSADATAVQMIRVKRQGEFWEIVEMR